MIVRVETGNKKHVNFYEGEHIGFHPVGKDYKDGLTVIVEGKKTGVTIEVEKDSNTRIFLMNNQGKTIESIFC